MKELGTFWATCTPTSPDFMNTPELLAPAGSFEGLKTALHYGADAVYGAGESFGLRHKAQNFSLEQLKEALEYVHERDKRFYLTVNALMHESDLSSLRAFMSETAAVGVDAFIVSDLGAARLAREVAPELELHVSTQASVANSLAAETWWELGAARIIAARELSLRELAELREKMPADMDLEVFVHGAMCLAVSGRCILSNYLAGRDANKGHCSHTCRWNYQLMEEKRPGEYLPVIEEDGFTTILSPQDLNMLEHLDALREIGVHSLKIEGRTKGVNYLATVVNAYRQVLDGAPAEDFIAELRAQSYRTQGTGFYFGHPHQFFE